MGFLSKTGGGNSSGDRRVERWCGIKFSVFPGQYPKELCQFNGLLIIKRKKLTLSQPETVEESQGVNALFMYASEGIMIVNEKGEIVRMNPSAVKLFGYSQDELQGEKIERLIPKRYAHKHVIDRQKYIGNPHARSMGLGLDLYALRKDGTEFPVEVSLSPYTTEEGKFVFAFIVDITLRKQSELKLKNYSDELARQVKNRTLILEEAIRELEKTKNELNISLEKERELSELKSRFVSMASHEFRTPLATILSSLSLVTKYGEINEPEKQSKHIRRIKSSINNLTDILNDFLSVSRLEEGKIVMMATVFEIRPFIAEIIGEMSSVLKAGQQIKNVCTGNEEVSADKKLLKNILFNLISNAIKFSPEGSTIEINSQVTHRELTIQVKDYGIGISKPDQARLFERFYRAHNAAHIQGTGLGLHIISRYLELMNGTVELESEENKGSTFTIKIPQ
jgi:PAS domain S-box-containing protein